MFAHKLVPRHTSHRVFTRMAKSLFPHKDKLMQAIDHHILDTYDHNGCPKLPLMSHCVVDVIIDI